MTIRDLPPSPSRDRPNEFSGEMDVFLAALPGFVDDANALEQSLQLVATTGTSATTLTVGVGSKSLTTQPGKAWATGAWVYVFAAAAVSNYMVGRVTSYDVETGALVVNVSAIDGSGSHSSWIIGLATPAADAHLVARDGSRAMTAELILSGDAVNQLGAVSLRQLQALASSALSFSGLSISATGTSSNVSILASELLLRGAGGLPRLVSGVNLMLNTAGAGDNGLDTGTIAASTWYALWVIDNGTTTASLLSLSGTAPTMPAGYTHKARVGWIRTDSTANKYPLAFVQRGRRVQYVLAGALTAYPALFFGTTSGAQAVSVSSFCPNTAAAIAVTWGVVGTGSGATVAIGPNAAAAVSSSAGFAYLGSSSNTFSGTNNCAMLLESTNIYVNSSNGNGHVSATGWEDNL